MNARLTFPTHWQPEHDEMLKACFLDSMSFSEAAAAINGKFGTSYSRNSAIGRAHRMGLNSNNEACKRSPRQRVTQTPRLVRIPKPKPPKAPVFPLDAAGLRTAKVEPLNVSFADLQSCQCKWAYGDRTPYLFCGHPQAERKPYCAEHVELSHRDEWRGPGPITLGGSCAIRKANRPNITSIAREYNGEDA